MTFGDIDTVTHSALGSGEIALMQAWWRAANYLSVAQIYLSDNPLPREPLEIEHIKPRLLGHWGTTPGLNFIYLHLNRIISARNLDILFLAGPGHGAPGVVASTLIEHGRYIRQHGVDMPEVSDWQWSPAR